MKKENKNKTSKPSLIKRFFNGIKSFGRCFLSYKDIKENKNSYLLSVLSGILYILLFPKISFGFLAWLAVVPFLLAIRDKEYKTVFRLGIVFGFIAFYGSLFWINFIRKYNMFAVVGIPFLGLYLGLYHAIFGLLTAFFRKHYPKYGFLFSAFSWVALEFYRSIGTFAWPFSILACSQTNTPAMLQICDITGVYGVSFILIITNILIADAIYLARSGRLKTIPLQAAITVGLLVFNFTYSGMRMHESRYKTQTRASRIAIMQPSISQDTKFKSYMSDDLATRLALHKEINYGELQMVRDSNLRDLDLLIMPETTFVTEDFDEDKELQEKIVQLSKDINSDILFGVDKYVFLDQNGQITEDRKMAKGYGAYNTARICRKKTGIEKDFYAKIHLLPFGEYVPYFDKIPYFQSLIVQVGSFLQGKEYTVFDVDSFGHSAYKFGTGICIESVIPSVFRNFRKNGADFFVVISNDAWYEDTAGPIQHTEFCVFRAVENRSWLARCGNHGISGLISPYGVWHEKTKINEKKIIEMIIPPAVPGLTFYARFGDVFAIMVCGIILIMTGYVKIRSRKIKDN